MTNKKAQKILKKKIKNKFCKYTFVDIDNDKIDEMIVLGFSGKFIDGDDKEKTLNVYKVSGKKAKSVLSYSIEGDFYHPSLSFNLYYDGASYITINHEHEGYAYYTTYKFTVGNYESCALIEDWVADNEQYYYTDAAEEVSKEEYYKFMKNILANEVNVELKSCSVKVANKYLKKMLKAEFDYRKGNEFYNNKMKTEYMDVDGNGIDELIVWKDSSNVDVFYAINPNNAEYYIDIAPFKLVDGEFVYDGDVPRSDDEIEALAGTWYAGGELDADFFYIDGNGIMTEYHRTKGDPEATEGRTYRIVFAADDYNEGFFLVPEEQGVLQTYFTFSPMSENGEGDRLLFDGGAYFYQRME